jgi:hypothetical protein
LYDAEADLPWWKRRPQLSQDRFPDYESEPGRWAVKQLFRRPPVLVRIGNNSYPSASQYHLLQTIEELDRVLAGIEFQALVEAHSVRDIEWREVNPDRVCVLFNDQQKSQSQ